MGRKITTEEWIAKAKEVHGDTYDYSESEYIKCNEKIKIICRKHGVFEQRASNHISKSYGCPKCKGEECAKRCTLTKEEFIEKAKQIHGDKYDYSKVEYVNQQTKVCIICPEHGEFWQIPGNHINSTTKEGCPKCGRKKVEESRRIPLKIQLEKAKIKHGDKYDYSLNTEEFVRCSDIIKIICPIHGEFEQVLHNHIKGEGCYECGQMQTHDKQRLTLEEFVERANKAHNGLYDYSKVSYTKYNDKVEIICQKHGSFMQTPSTHLQGAGCPKCKRSRGEEIVSKTLTNIGIEFIEQYRIKVDSNIRNECVIDFYLPNENCFVEFNGVQHYRPIRFFGGQEQLKVQKERDEDVKRYCEKNCIKLILISYLDENIEETLKQRLYEKG